MPLGRNNMQKKPLKPPFYRLMAICTVHGIVYVDRKPNPKAGQKAPDSLSGQLISPYSETVVCPHCVFHCHVVTGELIEEEP